MREAALGVFDDREAARGYEPGAVRQLGSQEELDAPPVSWMIDGDAASLVQCVQSQTGGIGVACQSRQLCPTAVFALLAHEIVTAFVIDSGSACAQPRPSN